MNKKVLVIGSINTDLSIRVNTLPGAGETVMGDDFKVSHGGKGANQAVASKRLTDSADVAFFCRQGMDEYGKSAIRHLENEGVDTSNILSSESHSGMAFIMVDKKGENSITVSPGSNYDLSVEDIDAASNLIDESDIVLIQLEIPIPVVARSIKLSKEKGKYTILNPAPAFDLPEDVFCGIDLFIPNSHEAEYYSGKKVTDYKTAEEAAKIILAKGVGAVIITLGSEGSIYCDKNGSFAVPARPVNVVDTTAAGDTFVGAVAAALSEEMTIREAIEFATKAASLSVQKPGAQESLPYRNQLPNN